VVLIHSVTQSEDARLRSEDGRLGCRSGTGSWSEGRGAPAAGQRGQDRATFRPRLDTTLEFETAVARRG
jgi:hypothetical protein